MNRSIFTSIILTGLLVCASGFCSNLALAEEANELTGPAEPLAACARLVNECFGDNIENETANCLYSSANHPFCKGTSLGKITYQRWLMSPVRVGGIEEGAPSFLGPKLVDQECLKTFDTFFVSSLVKGSELESQIDGMQEKLSSCTKELSPDFSSQ